MRFVNVNWSSFMSKCRTLRKKAEPSEKKQDPKKKSRTLRKKAGP
jgi:hypothetical protein